MYALLKNLHVAAVAATIAGFLLRGYWALAGSPLLSLRTTRIAPHVIDTLLLASGIALVVELNLAVLHQGWLLAKIAGIVAYILLGLVALRFATGTRSRALAYAAAIGMFAYVVGTALTKSPASWLVLFAA